jgi:hypothetical protein
MKEQRKSIKENNMGNQSIAIIEKGNGKSPIPNMPVEVETPKKLIDIAVEQANILASLIEDKKL